MSNLKLWFSLTQTRIGDIASDWFNTQLLHFLGLLFVWTVAQKYKPMKSTTI